jgi:hypothetical protein
MKITYISLLLLFLSGYGFAQTELQDWGKIEKSDLEMKACSFDKEADAMVLFDKGELYFSDQLDVYLKCHKRIKIFNEKGKSNADIRLPYYSGSNIESISGVSAQTISLNEKGEKVIQKLEGKLIYNEQVSTNVRAYVFSFPNVQPGSVIEYKYTLKTNYFNIPDWYFQSDIPVRYSYLRQEIVEIFDYTAKISRRYPMAIDKTEEYSKSFFFGGQQPISKMVKERVLAVKNIPALDDEPYMTADKNYLQRVTYQLNRIQRPLGGWEAYLTTWEKLTEGLTESERFGSQLRKNIQGTETFIKQVKAMSGLEKKAAAVYDYVRGNMKWDGSDSWGSSESVGKIWQKHTGSSGEINLILLNLLREADVPAKPLLVSTRDHGEVNQSYPFLDQFNKTVAYVAIDSTHALVLDATEKHLPYNLVAWDILNTNGFVVKKGPPEWIFVYNDTPNRLTVNIVCDISKEGAISGKANLYSANYGRTSRSSKFINDGEVKYKDFLKDGNTNLTITKLDISNAEIDSLSLIQNVDFNLQNASGDDNYIYFNPNLFLGLSTNPFIKEKRLSDVDFGYLRNYTLSGFFNIPEGYAPDELPKNMSLVLQDESVMMRRMILVDGQKLSYRFTLSFKKPVYKAEEYDQLYDFYKKMYAILAEQIVLKKI